MQTRSVIVKLTSKTLFALICGLTLFLSSCQKDSFGEMEEEESFEVFSTEDIDFQKMALKQVYDIPTENMTEAQIQRIYSRSMAKVPADELTRLKEYTAEMETEMHTQLNVSRISIRSGETILSPSGATSSFGQSVTSNRSHFMVGDEGKVSIYTDRMGRYDLTQSFSDNTPNFGRSVSSGGDWLAVGAYGSFEEDWLDGKVVLYKNERGVWTENQTIPAEAALFGDQVVVDGNTLAVKARSASLATSVIYVYKYDGSSWVKVDEIDRGYFYWSIDMHRGRIAANGFEGSNFFSPTVSIFTKNFFGDDSYRLEGEQSIPGALSREVAISGNTIVANNFFSPFFARSNTSYIYSLDKRTWGLSAEVTLPVPANTLAQGLGLDISGSKVVVSLPVYQFCCGAEDGDAVFVFEGSRSSWNLTETFTPSDDAGLTSIYGTERGVAIHGTKVLVGATAWNGGTKGKVYVH